MGQSPLPAGNIAQPVAAGGILSRYNPDKHHRQSIRLRGWDYRQPGAYFVTIVTAGRDLLFGQMTDGLVALSPFGRMATAGWQRLAHHFSQVRLDEFVVMPNHVHGIIWLTDECQRRGEAFPTSDPQSEGLTQGDDLEQPTRSSGMPHPYQRARLQSGSLGAIVGNYKSVVARRINRTRVHLAHLYGNPTSTSGLSAMNGNWTASGNTSETTRPTGMMTTRILTA